MRNHVVVLLSAGSLVTGCTHWGYTNVYGPQQEVGRQLAGAPSVAQTKSSSLAAGFGGSAGNGSASPARTASRRPRSITASRSM